MTCGTFRASYSYIIDTFSLHKNHYVLRPYTSRKKEIRPLPRARTERAKNRELVGVEKYYITNLSGRKTCNVGTGTHEHEEISPNSSNGAQKSSETCTRRTTRGEETKTGNDIHI